MDWKDITSVAAVLISMSSLALSWKVRRDGIILRDQPRVDMSFSRADRDVFCDSAKHAITAKGYKVRTEILLTNPSVHPVELQCLSLKDAAFLVHNIGELTPAKGYRELVPDRSLTTKPHLVKSESKKLYHFDLFVPDDLVGDPDHPTFPKVAFDVTLLHMKSKPRRRLLRIRRDIIPGTVVTTKR